MITDTMRLYFMLRHAGYPEEKCWSVCFNYGKICGFSLLNKDTQYLLIFHGNFWLYLNLNSLSWIMQPFSSEEIYLEF